jgi:hypothetical protein
MSTWTEICIKRCLLIWCCLKKIPATAGNIILQQDGAKLHLQEDDEAFETKVTELFRNPDARPTEHPSGVTLSMTVLSFTVRRGQC